MKKLTFDLESRSAVALRKCGAYRYAADASTDILCFAFKEHSEPPKIWVPDKFLHLYDFSFDVAGADEFAQAVDRAEVIEAHNAGFEAAMWAEIMVKRYGFKPLPMDKLRCSAALAAMHALPRALGEACMAVGLSVRLQKDAEGKKIMMRFAKRKKATKRLPERWYEDVDDFTKLCDYCKQDVVAEEALSDKLHDMPDEELGVWRLDQTINNRGFAVDLPGIAWLIDLLNGKETALLAEVKTLTAGQVDSVRQVAATVQWLRSNGVQLDSLGKEYVTAALKKGGMIPEARRILEIRQQLGKSSVSKLATMQRMACADGRVRGTLVYHGASTGRWTGKGPQPQNYPRDSYSEKAVDEIITLDSDMVELLYDDTFKTASRCLRGMITAGPGKMLVAADFNAIEARVLAWLAGETKTLDAFRSGLDLYKVTACDIYPGVKYDEVSKDQRLVGKVAVLALGYQGWLGAFASMAEIYGVKVSEDNAKEIILAWRNSHPNTKALWKGLELAAIKTIRSGRPHAYGRIKFGMRDDFLHMRLPSGRLLSYYKPSLVEGVSPYGEPKTSIRFLGVDSVKRKWVRQATYGGKLAENCLAGDTKVLTGSGWKQIKSITESDLVFDGFNFVKHGGLICQGKKPTGKWLGVRATGNHLVTNGATWLKLTALDESTALECLKYARGLVSLSSLNPVSGKGPTRYANAIVGGCTKLKRAALLEVKHVAKSAATLAQEKSGLDITGFSTREACFTCGGIGTPGLSRAATTPIARLSKTTGAVVSQFMDLGGKTEVCFLTTSRRCPDTTNQNLISIESTIAGATFRAICALLREAKTLITDVLRGLSNTEGAKCLIPNLLKHIARSGLSMLPVGISARAYRSKMYWQSTGSTENVYDLLDCGPLHRFVIKTDSGPVIVHNCTQAVARDLLVSAMLRIDKAGYPIVMHVHDEVVAEHAKPDLDKFLSLMTVVPDWAAGCPIAAEGWIGKRYRK